MSVLEESGGSPKISVMNSLSREFMDSSIFVAVGATVAGCGGRLTSKLIKSSRGANGCLTEGSDFLLKTFVLYFPSLMLENDCEVFLVGRGAFIVQEVLVLEVNLG